MANPVNCRVCGCDSPEWVQRYTLMNPAMQVCDFCAKTISELYQIMHGGAPTSQPRNKDVISRALKKRVHEKHAYRCVTCDSHLDLCCDHIVPESKGGATTFENLQSMCRPCNSRKGATA